MKSIGELQGAIVRWSDQTFGRAPTVTAKLNHLRREVQELTAKPHDVSEMADILILLLYIAQRAGTSGEGLLAAAEAKLEILKRRQWGPPDAEGCCPHIEGGAS